ncbi:MAG: metallophosphoesterase [Kiritimatiellae bacterium]|nr:metallophosphoesterase [Kiritimatiellia bacterium]
MSKGVEIATVHQCAVSRRAFLNGMASTMALTALGGGIATSSVTSNLVLGIVSDIHLSMRRRNGVVSFHGEGMLRRAFEWFRSRGVHAVALCGDMADIGLVEELEAVARIWNEAFGSSTVERLFVYGNHDWEGMNYDNRAKELFGDGFIDHTIRKDLGAAWRKAFCEDFSPVWRKEVMGYTFIGAHWIADRTRGADERGVPQAEGWFKANGPTLDPSKPFFYIQHPPLKNTCVGPWHWGRDNGVMTELFGRSFHNAIALTGHSHVSLTDERSIWQGPFASVNAGSLSYTGIAYGDLAPVYRENDLIGASQDDVRRRIMSRANVWDGHQGMLARVYDDRIVFERRDFEDMGLLGEDWVLPLGGGSLRRTKHPAPEFVQGATLEVRKTKGKNRGGGNVASEEQDVLEIVIPAANRAKCGRVFDYAVEFSDESGGRDVRAVFAAFFHRSLSGGAPSSPTVFQVALKQIAVTGKVSIAVTPRDSLGTCGKPLYAKWMSA